MKKLLMGLLLTLVAHVSHAELTSISGDEVNIDKGWVHLIFFEIWISYGDQQPQSLIASLPANYHHAVQKVWLQPKFNVTQAQAQEFQSAFPIMKPLVLDENFSLMRKHGLWDLPSHVIIKDGKEVFKGNGEQLQQFVSNTQF